MHPFSQLRPDTSLSVARNHCQTDRKLDQAEDHQEQHVPIFARVARTIHIPDPGGRVRLASGAMAYLVRVVYRPRAVHSATHSVDGARIVLTPERVATRSKNRPLCGRSESLQPLRQCSLHRVLAALAEEATNQREQFSVSVPPRFGSIPQSLRRGGCWHVRN